MAESLVLAAAVEEADAERAAAIAAPSPSGGGAPENGAKPTASPAEGALASTDGGGPAGDGPTLEDMAAVSEYPELGPYVIAVRAALKDLNTDLWEIGDREDREAALAAMGVAPGNMAAVDSAMDEL